MGSNPILSRLALKFMIFVISFLKILIIIVPLLIAVAYFTLVERKILGAIQRRRGPNVLGVYGLLQPLSDGFKLLVKETILPSNANKFIFILAPIITFVISLMGWAVIPYSKYSVLIDLNISLLYIFAVSSLGIYGIIMSGWSSNSKYAFLGALRSTAQMVSYEISIGIIILCIVIITGSFNLNTIVISQSTIWYFIPFFPLFLMFFTCSLAETNRHPFDLPEAESELVSGYNVEYSAMGFALFSLGEYSNMLLMSSINVILFFGGWLSFFSIDNFFFNMFSFGIKICFFVILFIFMRAALPRYRYDQLMNLGWKVFVPVSIIYFLIIVITLVLGQFQPF